MNKKIRILIQELLFSKNRGKTNAQIFNEIYHNGLWRKKFIVDSEYYSGKGSDSQYAIPYAKLITKFIQDNQIHSIVDLGCGDFRVASHFANNCEHYIGIDCVQTLIDHNQKTYCSNNDNIMFLCMDITQNKLPIADVCLVRQVLQHLSNSDIQKVLDNIKNTHYKYIIVTEHLLNCPSSEKNTDKVAGLHTRLFLGSGVYLDAPPFNCKIKSLSKIPYDAKSYLETFLVFL